MQVSWATIRFLTHPIIFTLLLEIKGKVTHDKENKRLHPEHKTAADIEILIHRQQDNHRNDFKFIKLTKEHLITIEILYFEPINKEG